MDEKKFIGLIFVDGKKFTYDDLKSFNDAIGILNKQGRSYYTSTSTTYNCCTCNDKDDETKKGCKPDNLDFVKGKMNDVARLLDGNNGDLATLADTIKKDLNTKASGNQRYLKQMFDIREQLREDYHKTHNEVNREFIDIINDIADKVSHDTEALLHLRDHVIKGLSDITDSNLESIRDIMDFDTKISKETPKETPKDNPDQDDRIDYNELARVINKILGI